MNLISFLIGIIILAFIIWVIADILIPLFFGYELFSIYYYFFPKNYKRKNKKKSKK